jgi:APA family basic amino acid/polyamine antiporter
MWEASKTVVNPDGTVTVTKLAGMAILGAAGATIINSLFSSDAWNNVTLLLRN